MKNKITLLLLLFFITRSYAQTTANSPTKFTSGLGMPTSVSSPFTAEGFFWFTGGKLNVNNGSVWQPYLSESSASTTYIPLTRALTINGVTQNLSVDRTFTIPNYWTSAGGNIYNNTGTFVGIGSTVPTHGLTLGSASNSLAQYSTVDQITNFERVTHAWSGTNYNITSQSGGTGVIRPIGINVNNSLLSVNNVAQGLAGVTIARVGGQIGLFSINGESTISTAFSYSQGIFTTLSQSGDAGWRGMFISPFQNTLGTGMKYLIDAGTNSSALGAGTHTSKFSVDNSGNIVSTGKATVAVAPVNPTDVVRKTELDLKADIGSGNVSAAATLSVDVTKEIQIFSGTIATWTLPVITGNTWKKLYIKNRGSGILVVNANGATNTIYTTTAVSTFSLNPGESVILVNDGTYWNKI